MADGHGNRCSGRSAVDAADGEAGTVGIEEFTAGAQGEVTARGAHAGKAGDGGITIARKGIGGGGCANGWRNGEPTGCIGDGDTASANAGLDLANVQGGEIDRACLEFTGAAAAGDNLGGGAGANAVGGASASGRYGHGTTSAGIGEANSHRGNCGVNAIGID